MSKRRGTYWRGHTLMLPDFEILARQPNRPHVARIVASNDIANKYGTLVTVKVYEARNHKAWWISASLGGMRASNTVKTTKHDLAQQWIEAVEAGRVAVDDVAFQRKVAEARQRTGT